MISYLIGVFFLLVVFLVVVVTHIVIIIITVVVVVDYSTGRCGGSGSGGRCGYGDGNRGVGVY